MLWMWIFHDVCTASIKPMQSLGKMRALKYKYFGQVDFMEVLPRLTHFSRLSNCSRKRSPISHQMRIFMRNVFFSTKNKTVLLGNTMTIIYSLIFFGQSSLPCTNRAAKNIQYLILVSTGGVALFSSRCTF